jgi:endothelin-converting enzyme
VCGGWDERHDLRPDQGDAFTGTIMSENSQTLLRHILEAPYPENSKHSSFSPAQLLHSLSSTDQQNFNKLKDGYNACMDEDNIKRAGITPLTKILKQISDMYLATSTKTDLGDTLLLLSKFGVSALISTGAGADDTDPDSVVVVVSPPYRIGLPAKDYYKDESVVEKYEVMLSEVFAGLSKETSLRVFAEKNITHDVVEFEKKLAAASPDAADQNDVTVSKPISIHIVLSLTSSLEVLQSDVAERGQ